MCTKEPFWCNMVLKSGNNEFSSQLIAIRGVSYVLWFVSTGSMTDIIIQRYVLNRYCIQRIFLFHVFLSDSFFVVWVLLCPSCVWLWLCDGRFYLYHTGLNHGSHKVIAVSKTTLKDVTSLPNESMCLLPDTSNCRLQMRRECRERFPLSPRVSDPDIHHGTCVTQVPWCMPGSLTSGFLLSRWRGKRSRHSQPMRNP